MPELAEVEIVRRGLLPLVGSDLSGVHLHDAKLGTEAWQLVGEELTGLERHGKLLGFIFGDRVLEAHLRMTGSLVYGDDPKARAVLDWDGEEGRRSVSFLDPRRFGTLRVGDAGHFGYGQAPDLAAASPAELARAAVVITRSRRPVKAILLDQRAAVAGIGNYMADEAIGRVSGTDPAQPGSSIGQRQALELLHQARLVANTAIEHGGVSMRDYQHSDGSRGEMQNQLLYYGRAGKPCPRCDTLLVKTRVAGRGTTYCPVCSQQQKSSAEWRAGADL